LAREFGLDPTEVAQWPWQKRLHWSQSLSELDQQESEQADKQLPDDAPSHDQHRTSSSVTPGVAKHGNVITT
jgi:hypothetical protein